MFEFQYSVAGRVESPCKGCEMHTTCGHNCKEYAIWQYMVMYENMKLKKEKFTDIAFNEFKVKQCMKTKKELNIL